MHKKEEDLKIAENHDLNEEAEYTGSKQDLEQLLLEAQRYLNIFHQIHIFRDKKKNEFEQSLIEMPERLRALLLNLPGGRVLLEYIEECEIKRGLRKERTIFVSDNSYSRNEKEAENKSTFNKEFTKAVTDTIAETLSEYNKSLLQMNEQILNKSKQIQGNVNNNQAKILADVLRENNQQQMDMMKTFGSTLSQAILMSQKEIFSSADKQMRTNPVFNDFIKKNTTGDKPENKEERQVKNTHIQVAEKNIYNSNVTQNHISEAKQATRPVEYNVNPYDNKQNNPQTATTKPEIRNEIRPEPKVVYRKEPQPGIKTEFQSPVVSPVEDTKKEDFTDIDITNLLNTSDEIENKVPENKGGQTEKTEGKMSSFSAAMQKIKNAITEPAGFSLDDNITPVSLSGNDDSLSNSFADAFKEPAAQPVQENPQTNAQKWQYVDEDGNPIDPSEWEYVDEDGNPVDPSEWEYVDENGNPIKPGDWEYVDENGIPLAK